MDNKTTVTIETKENSSKRLLAYVEGMKKVAKKKADKKEGK